MPYTTGSLSRMKHRERATQKSNTPARQDQGQALPETVLHITLETPTSSFVALRAPEVALNDRAAQRRAGLFSLEAVTVHVANVVAVATDGHARSHGALSRIDDAAGCGRRGHDFQIGGVPLDGVLGGVGHSVNNVCRQNAASWVLGLSSALGLSSMLDATTVCVRDFG